MKIFLVQTQLSGNTNGHFQIVANLSITTKKQAFEHWNKFADPFNIIELDIPSSIGNVDYPDYKKEIKDKYKEMKEHFHEEQDEV